MREEGWYWVRDKNFDAPDIAFWTGGEWFLLDDECKDDQFDFISVVRLEPPIIPARE